ncbi:EF-hand domain-containing protein [Leisingera thetidis]|uniref:EF-hand domain-containing protein n=1 Tax=Leisingera thetidis TaxID=2930199 RepID=UPI0021F6A684|nr:EF-hand domain-containing protein [Leisingera thetidis]
MKKFAMTATAIAALMASPLAAKELAAELDADGNGTFSLEELQLAFPDLTAETFTTIDANADGEADAAEVSAAIEAGVLTQAG